MGRDREPDRMFARRAPGRARASTRLGRGQGDWIMKKTAKKPYIKPAVVYRDRVDVMAAVCNSGWVPSQVCRILGNPSCVKTRL